MRQKETSIKQSNDDHRAADSVDLFQINYSSKNTSLTKVVMINKYEKLIFARYNSHIVLPWFTISDLLHELNEEKTKKWVSLQHSTECNFYFSCFLRQINLVLNPS